jgi:hypothetical protein
MNITSLKVNSSSIEDYIKYSGDIIKLSKDFDNFYSENNTNGLVNTIDKLRDIQEVLCIESEVDNDLFQSIRDVLYHLIRCCEKAIIKFNNKLPTVVLLYDSRLKQSKIMLCTIWNQLKRKLPEINIVQIDVNCENGKRLSQTFNIDVSVLPSVKLFISANIYNINNISSAESIYYSIKENLKFN